MATAQINRIVEHLRHAALSQDGAELSDGQLLDAFIASRQESAFELLVRRHAAMVLGVCLRVLGNHHDAEDAFQATFLVLVRKAASIKPRELVGNWLYGVAYQTAVRARASANKRQAREATMTPTPSIEANDLWHDLQPLLDQELTRLGDKYRVPIVLCDLEGKSRKEAAAQIGVPEGTLNSRLARGRTMLADRLTRRGVTLSAGALAAILAEQSACASASVALIAATVKVGAGAAATNVALLADGVVKAMFLAKLAQFMAVSVLAFALVSVMGYTGYLSVTNKSSAALPGLNDGGTPATDKKLAGATEVAKLLEQFKANADQFELTIGRCGPGISKTDLRSVMLHASNRRFEPAALGPAGNPIFKNARITKDQALKLINALHGHPASVFSRGVHPTDPLRENDADYYIEIRYGPDSKPGPRLRVYENFTWLTIGLSGQLGDCVDSDAAASLRDIFEAIRVSAILPGDRARSQLAGTWRLVGIEGGGEKLADRQIDDVIRAKMRWLANMEGRKWQPGFLPPRIQLFLAFDADGKWKHYTEGDPSYTFMNSEGTSNIELAKKPKTIDLSVRQSNNKHKVENDREKKGTIKKGIYDTVDDTLRICWAAPDKERPTDFSTTKENGQVIWVMQRVRKAADESVLDTWTVASVKGTIKKVDWLTDAETMRFTNAAKVRGVETPSTVLIECKTGKVYVTEFALRETTKPKGINFIPLREGEGPILHGIYEIKYDVLKICVSTAGVGRPTDFEAKENRVLLTLHRADLVREIDLKGYNQRDLPKGELNKPTVIQDAAGLTKAFPEKDWQAKIAKQVDFRTHQLAYYAWAGPVGGKLTYKIDLGQYGPHVHFDYRHNAGGDEDASFVIVAHRRLFAISQMASWGGLPDPTGNDVQPADTERLQGRWQSEKFELAGETLEHVASFVEFKGDKFNLRYGKASWEGTFKLDPNAKPSRIDLTVTKVGDGALNTTNTWRGKQWQGVYTFDGAKLKICFGKDRPKGFPAKTGAEQEMHLLKRIEEKNDSPRDPPTPPKKDERPNLK